MCRCPRDVGRSGRDGDRIDAAAQEDRGQALDGPHRPPDRLRQQALEYLQILFSAPGDRFCDRRRVPVAPLLDAAVGVGRDGCGRNPLDVAIRRVFNRRVPAADPLAQRDRVDRARHTRQRHQRRAAPPRSSHRPSLRATKSGWRPTWSRATCSRRVAPSHTIAANDPRRRPKASAPCVATSRATIAAGVSLAVGIQLARVRQDAGEEHLDRRDARRRPGRCPRRP